jgi:glyoxylase-like metal-dependent hydrolase (beta-lactamase superfamily II)
MSNRKHEMAIITPNFFRLGTNNYPAYLSLGNDGMIIEGGVGATFPIIKAQIEELSIDPQRIKYIALSHTHPDHIGAVPHLKKIWPHLKIIGGAAAEKALKREGMVEEFLQMDKTITENLLVKGEIDWWPPEDEVPEFNLDRVVTDGEQIDLGAGIVWTVLETPGHSPCHLSFHNEAEEILVIGDATGVFEPTKNLYWPNYFQSLEEYCRSIRRLAALPARIGTVSHGGVIERENVSNYLHKVLKATEAYHSGLMRKLDEGEDYKELALETAKWIYTFTNLQPFAMIHAMTKVTIKRSQAAADLEGLFDLELVGTATGK